MWVGARGIEFDWKYIQMSFESNINLVSIMCPNILIYVYMYKSHVARICDLVEKSRLYLVVLCSGSAHCCSDVGLALQSS